NSILRKHHAKRLRLDKPDKRLLVKLGRPAARSRKRAPNMNAFDERFVQSIQTECLDQFIVLGAPPPRVSPLPSNFRQQLSHFAVGVASRAAAPTPTLAVSEYLYMMRRQVKKIGMSPFLNPFPVGRPREKKYGKADGKSRK